MSGWEMENGLMFPVPESDCQSAGSCSDSQFTSQGDCETGSGTWVSAGLTWTAQILSDAHDPEFSISPITNPLSDCLMADAVDMILGQNPTLMSDIILDAVEPELDVLPNTIESNFNNIIDELTLSQSVDLMGTDMDVLFFPTTVMVDTAGVVVGFGSKVSVPIDDSCVDVSAFAAPSEVDWPSFDGQIFGSQFNYDSAIYIGRHFVEQALYGAWASGSMCIDVAQESGLDLTGEFTAAFFGEQINTLVGQQPVELAISPMTPFAISFSNDQPPISIIMDDLVLNGYADVMGRRTRLLQVNIDSEIELHLELSENSLYPDIPLTTDDFFLEEDYHEIFSPGYSEGVPALLDIALGTILQEDMFPIVHLPLIIGMELDTIIWEHDDDQEWLGAFAMLNTDNIQEFPITGCSASDLGCNGGGPQIDIDIDVDEVLGCNDVEVGCEGGCAQQGEIRLPAGRILGMVMIFVMGMLRRRE